MKVFVFKDEETIRSSIIFQMTTEIENKNKIKIFFKEEYNAMRSYIRSRINDAADRNADDIIQDVALKMLSRTDYSSPINNVAAFVYHSIKNKIIDTFRTKKSMNYYESDEADHFEAVISDFAKLFYGKSDNEYTEKMKKELMKAISNLKPDYREIIIAVDFEAYTYQELSDEMHVPIGTLLSRRHRALSLLTKQLEKFKQNDH